MIDNNVVYGCLVGVSCLAAIYVLFGPNMNQQNYAHNKRRKKAIKINGLENSENNCYANVVVQALCSSESFIDWLRESLIQQKLFSPNLLISNRQQPTIRLIQYLISIIFRNNLFYNTINSPEHQTIKFSTEKTLTFQLLKLLQDVNGSSNIGPSLNASKLLEILHNFNFRSRNEQQDAHELFNILISSLETEILRTLSTKDCSIKGVQLNELQCNVRQTNDVNRDDKTIEEHNSTDGSKSDGTNRPNECEKNDNVLGISGRSTSSYDTIKKPLNLKRNLPTKGLLANQMWCLKCDHKFTIQFESFNSISLAIPMMKKFNESITLTDCLNAFVSSEVVNDVVCENCQRLNEEVSSPNKKSIFVKRLTFAKLPQLLVIHFQRLVFGSSGKPMKKEDRIRFPRILTMDEYQYDVLGNGMTGMLNGAVLPTSSKQSSSSKLSTNRIDEQVNSAEFAIKQSHTVCQRIRADSHVDHLNVKVALSSPSESNFTDQPSKETNGAQTIGYQLAGDHTTNNGIENDEIASDKVVSNEKIANRNTAHVKVSTELSTPLETTEENNATCSNIPENHSLNGHNANKTLDFNAISTNKTSAANAYSRTEQSTKMSSNSIKSDPSTVFSSKQKNAKHNYRLSACIVHFGDSFSGHYVNHRRLPNTDSKNDWYFTSDMIVKPSNIDEALASSAYMLFYEKIRT